MSTARPPQDAQHRSPQGEGTPVTAARLLVAKARNLPAAGPVPSPCINICRMNARTGLCDGCFRTLDEVAAWGMMGDDERRATWALLEQRALSETA